MYGKKYLDIVAYYENCLAKYGDTPQGVDWSSKSVAETRYLVMLEMMPPSAEETLSVLDFGCGASHLLDLILQLNINHLDYSGLDLSPAFIELCRNKYPHIPYYCIDILDTQNDLPYFDYIIMNGVFTEKRTLSFDEMFAYFTDILRQVFRLARRGLAFNVASACAPSQQEEFFHVPFDQLATFLTTQLTPYFTIRHDYGQAEYTVYLYR